MSGSSIGIINPVGISASRQTGLAPRNHDTLQGLSIGLLDNNKPNADKFLEFVGELLQRRYGDIRLVPKRKMSRTEADCLPELIERCDVVINAFAD